MAVIVSMLRGVNVGGHNMVKMEALRALYESIGLRDPQTYVQSGNVVFRTDVRNVAAVATKIEDAIERSCWFSHARCCSDLFGIKGCDCWKPVRQASRD
jgi:uncharacterized protein (DUF1697 family)